MPQNTSNVPRELEGEHRIRIHVGSYDNFPQYQGGSHHGFNFIMDRQRSNKHMKAGEYWLVKVRHVVGRIAFCVPVSRLFRSGELPRFITSAARPYADRHAEVILSWPPNRQTQENVAQVSVNSNEVLRLTCVSGAVYELHQFFPEGGRDDLWGYGYTPEGLRVMLKFVK